MSESLPILYSFRRCPYAMRARIALHYSGINCELREVALRDKPDTLLAASPKGTVPVLLLSDGSVIDESMDLIHYAVAENDPENISDVSAEAKFEIDNAILKNDKEFAVLLRKYKYFEKYPEETQEAYKQQIESSFLEKYEQMLGKNKFLFGKKSIADFAILPFIRQFAFVDEEWFLASKYKNIIAWLNEFIESDIFEEIILAKHDPWKEGDKPIYFI